MIFQHLQSDKFESHGRAVYKADSRSGERVTIRAYVANDAMKKEAAREVMRLRWMPEPCFCQHPAPRERVRGPPAYIARRLRTERIATAQFSPKLPCSLPVHAAVPWTTRPAPASLPKLQRSADAAPIAIHSIVWHQALSQLSVEWFMHLCSQCDSFQRVAPRWHAYTLTGSK